MEIDIDGALIQVDEEILKPLMEDRGMLNSLKRAYLKSKKGYSDNDLINPEFVKGAWAGVIETTKDPIANARKKKIAEIESNYKR